MGENGNKEALMAARRKKKRKSNTIPLKVLERRLKRLNAVVKKRGGKAL